LPTSYDIQSNKLHAISKHIHCGAEKQTLILDGKEECLSLLTFSNSNFPKNI
jgi:hypothetical protein